MSGKQFPLPPFLLFFFSSFSQRLLPSSRRREKREGDIPVSPSATTSTAAAAPRQTATAQLPPFAPLAKIRREIPDSAKNHGSQILLVVVARTRKEGAVYLQQASGQKLPSSVASTRSMHTRFDTGTMIGDILRWHPKMDNSDAQGPSQYLKDVTITHPGFWTGYRVSAANKSERN